MAMRPRDLRMSKGSKSRDWNEVRGLLGVVRIPVTSSASLPVPLENQVCSQERAVSIQK